MKNITIKENDRDQTLIKYLNKYLNKAPNSLLYKWIRKKKIKVNKSRIEPSYMLKLGDVINFYIYDEVLEEYQEDKKFFNSLIQVDIAFENEDVIIFDKNQNTLVHAADKSDYGKNVVDYMVDLLISKEEFNPRLEKTFRPSIVNRLDRNTMGLVIGAKNRESLLNLNSEKDKINKYYLTIVEGNLVEEMTINNRLSKDENNYVRLSKSGKDSTTIIKPIKSHEKYSLVEIELKTGRTHQIRTTLASINHPIIGDRRYGNHEKSSLYKDQQLVAYKLKFDREIQLDSIKGKVIESKYKKYIYELYEKLIGGDYE